MKKYLYFILLVLSICFNWNRVEAKSIHSREAKGCAELDYNRFRYYNPETGQYISKDPIGLEGNNPNAYAYVDDSNTMVDTLGLNEKLTEGIVYKMASGTPDSMTPRPGKDTTSGISFSLDKPEGKYQAVDVAKLNGTGLEAINDHGSHVSIRPENDPDFKKLNEWASTRQIGEIHPYTESLMNSRIICK
ncbi:RHS repeat-associated core domain-containing protein [Apibacter muscae]|uniref:RHS repeat-associated core domain-containing protein n=1 Tax=Apibacter muscae TaxID=2509004 RepID=UPI0011AE0A32|nr:RHS repeat-associated core domain-containing protein [Apibacter muscae]TWP30471.1 RHS repeat-associated core domain-containing protein [Apibacter muscae]